MPYTFQSNYYLKFVESNVSVSKKKEKKKKKKEKKRKSSF